MNNSYTTNFEVAREILSKLDGDTTALVDGTKLAFSTFTTIPENYDFSQISDFSEMFYLSLIKNISSLNTTKGTDFEHMFYGCYYLTTIPLLNTSNGIDFSAMFQNCVALSNIPLLNTSNGTDFRDMFKECTSLTTISQLDLSSGTDFTNTFYYTSALENITFVGSINYNIDFSYSPLLTYDSIKSILTACATTTNTDAKTLKFNRTIVDNNGELAALITTCTSRGWTISGLTLN